MRSSSPGVFRGTAAPALCVLVAFAATHLTWPLLRPTPMALFYAAVLVGAQVGGSRAGALAVMLSAGLGHYSFLPPYGVFGTEPNQLLALAVYVLVATALVSLLSAQKRVASRERELRRWFAGTLSSVGDAVVATDTDGRVVFMNAVAETLTGWGSGDATGRELEEVFRIVGEETRETTESPVRRVLETGRVMGLANHTLLIARDGRERAIEDSAAPIRDDDGRLRGVILVFRDAADKRRAEVAAEEERRLRMNVLESITDAYFAFDADWRFIYVNEAAERVVGIGREELLGRDHWETFPDACGTPIEEGYRRAVREQVPVEFENYYEAWRRWYCCKASPVRGGGLVVYFRDDTERKQAEEVRLRLAAIVESSDDIIVSQTLDGFITSWNGGAERILGYAPDEIIGHHVSELMPPESREDTERILGRIRRGEKVDHYETRRRRKDGTIVDISVTVSPIRDSSGRIVGASKVGRDITQQKLIEAERIETDRRKDEFLAMLAHELRNPLAAIGNAIQLSTLGGPAEQIEWAMGVITRQMKHLTRLIDDLLDVSRISRGKIKLRTTTLELTPILESAVATVMPLVEERKHTMELSIDRGDLWVRGDPTRLEQVAVNLLNNAAKYSENGGHIRLSARNDGDEVVVSVVDRGLGIPPEKLPQMFELFSQGDRTLARSEGGLGIGLTVVKKLVEMHGGSVIARSEGHGKGSEFTVRLARAPRPADSVPEAPAPAAGRRRSRILAVDDNLDMARGLARLLGLLGHQVEIAHNGPEALESARRHRPDVVLLDIGLPGMDGYAVAAELRAEEFGKDALIIAVTGYGQEEDVRRSREAGFDHHLTKPLDHEALLALLSDK